MPAQESFDAQPERELLLRIDGHMSLDVQRRAAERIGELASEPRGVDWHDDEIGGVPCRVATPTRGKRLEIVQYLHGGYAMCSLDSHRRLTGHVALATGTPVVLVGYRLAPEHPFPTAIEDSVAVYRALLARVTTSAALSIAGESAGGGIAIATMLRLRDFGIALPRAAAVMSPWVDMTVSGASSLTNAATDQFVQAAGLRVLAEQVLGGADPRHPLASPLFADLAVLPDLLVQVAEDEVLLDDARRLVEVARAAGVEVAEDRVPDVQHAFQLSAGHLPEADAALRRLGEFFAARGIGDAGHHARDRDGPT